MAIPETLARLLTTPGPSGQEGLAAAAWREAAAGVGEVSTDVLGSSWVRVPGTAGGPSLAVVGHVDEIGVVVTHIGDDGLAAIRPLGGADPRVLLGQRVSVLSESGPVPGVIGARRVRRKPGEDPKPLGIEDVFLDIGAREGDEARGRVSVGDAAVWEGAPLALLGSRLASRSLDNRLGCYVALEVARRVAAEGGAPGDVIGMAVVQEEVGDFPGARTATYTVRPDIAVAVDVTHATDVRGGDPEEEGEVKLGSGAALTRGTSLHPAIYRLLRETADAEGIPFSVEVARGHTHTDADAVHLSRHGIATGLVSFPLRYMHSPVELVDLDDVEAVVRLLVAFAQRLEPGLSLAR